MGRVSHVLFILGLFSSVASGVYLIRDVTFGESNAVLEPAAGDTVFWRFPVSSQYALFNLTVNFTGSSSYPTRAYFHPRFPKQQIESQEVGPRNYISLNNEASNTITLVGEKGQTVEYFLSFSSSVELSPVPYPGSFILQVSAVADPSLLQISGAPGVVRIFNLTQQVQNSFFMADVTYTSDFDNLMVARVLPSYDHRYFSLRQYGLPSNDASLPFRGAGDRRFLYNEQEYSSGEHTIWIYTPQEPISIAPNVATNFTLKLYRTQLAYFRFSVEPGKVYSTSFSARAFSNNENFGVAMYNSNQRYPIPGIVRSGYRLSTVFADSGIVSDTINHCDEDTTNGNNAVYFSFTAGDNASPSSATYDQLASGSLEVTLEFKIVRRVVVPTSLNPNEEINPSEPSVFNVSSVATAALAGGSLLNIQSSDSASYIIGPAGQVGLSAAESCSLANAPVYDGVASAAGSSIFACERWTIDPVIVVGAGNFRYNFSAPLVFGGDPLTIEGTADARSFRVRLNGSLPLQSVIRVTPDSIGIVGTHRMTIKHLAGDCRPNLDVVSWSSGSTAPAYLTALCSNYGLIFDFPLGSNGSVTLESVGEASIQDLDLSSGAPNATFNLDAGQTRVVHVRAPAGETWSMAWAMSNVSSTRGSPRAYWGDCQSGIKGSTNTISPITPDGAYLVIPAAEEAQSVTVAFSGSTPTSVGTCIPAQIGSICSGRVPSLIWPLGFDLNKVQSSVQRDIFALNSLFPGQGSSSCYNAWLDTSCSATVPFCVNGGPQLGPGFVNAACFSKCKLAVSAGGCTMSQADVLCSKFESCGQAISLDFQLYGPPPLSPPAAAPASVTPSISSPIGIPVGLTPPTSGNAPSTSAKTPSPTSAASSVGKSLKLMGSMMPFVVILWLL